MKWLTHTWVACALAGCGAEAPVRAESPAAPATEAAAPARAFRATLAAGDWHTCALARDGAAWCWGGNGFGQLGAHTAEPNSAAPVRVASDRAWLAVSAGAYNTCAVDEGGAVACWGAVNFPGADVDAQDRAAASAPRVLRLPPGLRHVDVAAGLGHSCVLLDGGVAGCWGVNTAGQVGNGAARADVDPISMVKGDAKWRALAPGERHTCGLDTAGVVRCWGAGDAGQLARAAPKSCAMPGVSGPTPCDTWPAPIAVEGEGPFVGLGGGHGHVCAVEADGEAWCWGANDRGQLGRGGKSKFAANATIVPNAPKFAKIAAGSGHTCAITADGEAWCWGANDRGQIGDGATEDALAPTRVVTEARFVDIAAGRAHTCAADAGGRVWCWGHDAAGAATCGEATCSLAPRVIEGLPPIARPAR